MKEKAAQKKFSLADPRDEVVREIAEDMLRDYYSDNKIVFE